MVETFFKTLKTELVERTVFETGPRRPSRSRDTSTASTMPSGDIPRSSSSARFSSKAGARRTKIALPEAGQVQHDAMKFEGAVKTLGPVIPWLIPYCMFISNTVLYVGDGCLPLRITRTSAFEVTLYVRERPGWAQSCQPTRRLNASEDDCAILRPQASAGADLALEPSTPVGRSSISSLRWRPRRRGRPARICRDLKECGARSGGPCPRGPAS